jgi:hypothetical protein
MLRCLPFFLLTLLIPVQVVHNQVSFESLCSSEAEVSGMTSIDGDEEFEIDLYETKYLPDDTVLRKFDEHTSLASIDDHDGCLHSSVAIKQKRHNYGVQEFVLRAFDYDGNVVGRFDDRQTVSLDMRHHTCPNGAGVSVMIKFTWFRR